jgi:hypothetical protein
VERSRKPPHYPLLIGFLFLNGCFLDPVIGPGYLARMEVTDSDCTKGDNFEALGQVAAVEGFKKIQSHQDNERHAYYYIRNLNELEYRSVRHRFIQIWFSCGYKDSSLIVTVMNDWDGQQPALKVEIDRLSDRYVEIWKQRAGEGAVKEIRKRTGPPF